MLKAVLQKATSQTNFSKEHLWLVLSVCFLANGQQREILSKKKTTTHISGEGNEVGSRTTIVKLL